MKLKLVLLCAAASLAVASSSFAADLAPRAPEPEAPVALPFSWAGFYVGANAGYAFGTGSRANYVTSLPASGPSPFFAAETKDNLKGGFVGVTAGYNLQSGPLVYGIEGDVAYAALNSKRKQFSSLLSPGGDSGKVKDNHVRMFSTLRMRLGYTVTDNLLVYATGGAALIQQKVRFDDSTSGFQGRGSGTRFGWTVGLGAEYALNEHWSVKAEYLYAGFGSKTYRGTLGPAEAPNAAVSAKFKTNLNVVRLGINYRF